MRRMCVFVVFLLAVGLPSFASSDEAETTEAERWAVEDAADQARLGQTNTVLVAIGQIQLEQREWTEEDRRNIQATDAGLFRANSYRRGQEWVKQSASFQVRLANPGLLDWLQKHSDLKTIRVQGRLRVGGKYLLIEGCQPAGKDPESAPPTVRSKRGGM